MRGTQEAFEAALGRLVTGQPQHPELKERAAAGRLRVSIVTVAKEAGKSRTLIGHDGCPYPELRKRILGMMEEGPSARKERDLFKKTSARNADLTRRLAVQESIQAALVLELGRMRQELVQARPRLVRKR